jgi:hypothetical protein
VGCKALAQTLQSNAVPWLKVLNLSECQVDDTGILPLASAFATLQHIEQLILKKCADLGLFGAQGLCDTLFATLKSATHLKMINLSGILHTQNELKQLQRLFREHNFVLWTPPSPLDVSTCRITAGGKQQAGKQQAGKGDAKGVPRHGVRWMPPTLCSVIMSHLHRLHCGRLQGRGLQHGTAELRPAGFSAAELKESLGLKVGELHEAGFDARDLIAAHFSVPMLMV